MRMGVLYSGIYWQEFGIRRCGYSFDLLYVYKRNWSFDDYDIIIVTKGVHQGYLKENSSNIFNWVQKGGILITFGEVDGNWIKQSFWKPSTIGQAVSVFAKNHEIFNDISEDDINKWSKAVHGYFEKIPDNSKILLNVKDNHERIIAYLDESIGYGKVLSMTADPDYHSYTEIPFAKLMLNNILDWAIFQSANIRSKFIDPETNNSSFQRFILSLKNNIDVKKILIAICIGIIVGFLSSQLFKSPNNNNQPIKNNSPNELVSPDSTNK